MHTSLRRDAGGASEVVGALLLILIVVSASASFAVFLQSKQEEIQKRELANTKRESEALAVLKVVPELDAVTGDTWASLNFTVAVLHSEPTRITGVSVNDLPLQSFTAWRTNRTSGLVEATLLDTQYTLNLTARERFWLNVSVASDFFEAPDLLVTDFLRLELFTAYLNRFVEEYVPPTAIGGVTVEEFWNGTDFVPRFLLDGRDSDHPDEEARIVSWRWTINETLASERVFKGRLVKADFVVGVPYTIRLDVTDNFGMVGTDAFGYEY